MASKQNCTVDQIWSAGNSLTAMLAGIPMKISRLVIAQVHRLRFLPRIIVEQRQGHKSSPDVSEATPTLFKGQEKEAVKMPSEC